MKGTYDQFLAGIAPELLKDENQRAKTREQFETEREGMAAAFKGMQIVARKTLDGDRVELKVRLDGDPPMPGIEAPFVIEPMVKVGNEWKVGGDNRDYQPEWDNTGQIQSFAQ